MLVEELVVGPVLIRDPTKTQSFACWSRSGWWGEVPQRNPKILREGVGGGFGLIAGGCGGAHKAARGRDS